MPHRRHWARPWRERMGHWSSTRCPSFDNAESRLTTYERHVESHHGLGEPFQGEFTEFFERCRLLDRDSDPLGDKDLPVLGFGA